MSFLKQLLTPFIEFDEQTNKPVAPGKNTSPQVNNPAAPTTSKPVQPAKPVPVAPKVSPVIPAPVPSTHPLINVNAAPTLPDQVPIYSPAGTIAGALPQHEQYFEKLVDEANLKLPFFQGTDYKEFVDSKVDIDDITDEALRYKTAFNVLKSTGLTKEKLLATGQEYINLVGRDMNAFQSAYAQQYQKEVKQKENLIQTKANELQQLTQKINALKGEINQLSQDIDITKQKLDTNKNSFLLAGEKKQQEIQAELDKIVQYF